MDWKKIGKKLLFPPVWLLVILTVLSAASLIWVFVSGREMTITAYLIYALSFYTLSVVTVFCIMVLPRHWPQIRRRFHRTDRSAKVSFRTSLWVNVLYIVINLLSWYWNRSWWFIVVAVYYAIMAILWFLLVRYVHRQEPGKDLLAEWKRARSCSCILLLINLSLSGAVLMILYQHKGYDYPGILIYVMALYTFYSTIHAIIGVVRQQKQGSPILTTSQIISLSAALVSMLNLETAMFAQFGADLAPEHQRIFIILTGAGVSITVVTLSLLRIVKANREIGREINGK